MNKSMENFDLIIIGSGMVGLATAYQALQRDPKLRIAIIEKEDEVGKHGSGRNSGVLHAGIYYPPETLKSRVCIEGKNKLTRWINERGLPYKKTGKIVVPQRAELDDQLDVIYERGKKNGANISYIDASELDNKFAGARSATGRALWTPDTAQVDPKTVIKRLTQEVIELGVKVCLGIKDINIVAEKNTIMYGNAQQITYNHLFNCAGLNAHDIAKEYHVGLNYMLIPFKGIYYDLKPESQIHIPTNLYPVPDLELPFLGVHFTPSIIKDRAATIGPTATITLGRENYAGLDNIEPINAIKNLLCISNRFIKNESGFRKYAKEQALLSFKKLFVEEAKLLIPSLKEVDIKISSKVGIRPQLFDKKSKCMVTDFKCENGKNSTHVLNAISPAFTASFALADLILDSSHFLD